MFGIYYLGGFMRVVILIAIFCISAFAQNQTDQGAKPRLLVLPIQDRAASGSNIQQDLFRSIHSQAQRLSEFSVIPMDSIAFYTQNYDFNSGNVCSMDCAGPMADSAKAQFILMPQIDPIIPSGVVVTLEMVQASNRKITQKETAKSLDLSKMETVPELVQLFRGASEEKNFQVQEADDVAKTINTILWLGVFTVGGVIAWIFLF
jgi:hypothetical protein